MMRAFDAGARRRLALLGIAIAVAGAIWGLIEVLGGSDAYGANIATARLFPLVVAAVLFYFAIASGLRLAERQKILAPIGYLTALLGIVAFAAAARESFRGSFFFFFTGSHKLYEAIWIAAVAAGQISLLLSWPRRDDRGPSMATAALAALAVLALATAAAVQVASSGSPVSQGFFGVLMVAYLLGLVLVPLVELATRPEAEGY